MEAERARHSRLLRIALNSRRLMCSFRRHLYDWAVFQTHRPGSTVVRTTASGRYTRPAGPTEHRFHETPSSEDIGESAGRSTSGLLHPCQNYMSSQTKPLFALWVSDQLHQGFFLLLVSLTLANMRRGIILFSNVIEPPDCHLLMPSFHYGAGSLRISSGLLLP